MRLISNLKTTAAVLAVATSLAATAPVAVAQDIPPRVIGAVMVDELTMAPMQFAIEVELAASPADVFAFVSDSNNVDDMIGVVSSVSVSGDGMSRDLTLADGTVVTETILVNNAGKMSFAYSLPGDNPLGLSNHLAVMQVRPAEEREGAVLSWQQYFEGETSEEVMALYTEAAASLTDRFGGYSSGMHSGIADVTLTHTRMFNVSAQAVWAEVAENYAGAHEWSSVIESIEFEDTDGKVGDVRACFIPGLGGATREIITRYDEDNLTYAYTIEAGMPPFVTTNEAEWSVKPIDEDSSEVTVSIVFESAPGVPPQAVAFARTSFFMFAGFGIDDLKYFLENGEPYARQFPS
ncbi:SRPBCC family protein [uncultured Tateyamaria sp.]|uniref:SRPBCC family protein n=1 Tax=uncultured Tateyamaria sp. TaxID=455651 RepID=UPI002617B6CB|nr:SRPBCC family protein [uncultured Tateyamaria sp.]